jgi:hypothetical protein
MNIPHCNVIIATPGHSLMAPYVQSLILTIDRLNHLNIKWTWVNRFASHVGDAREITIGGQDPQDASDSRPLKGQITYDKIIWIDSDIAWTPEDFLKLYEAKEDIYSGAYLQSNGAVMAYPELLKPPYNIDEVKKMKKPVKVAAVGFGFVAVKQGVFESMPRPWFQSVSIKHKVKDEEVDFPLLGEDYSWCESARRAGFDIWFDPNIKVLHHKTMKMTWEGPRS